METSVIGEAERNLLIERGWIVVDDVVPGDLCEAAVQATAAFVGVDPDQPESWYSGRQDGHGIVPLHHGQALWNVRQHPAVHKLFASLYQDEALWVSMDRVSFKPPASGWSEAFRPSAIHWDADPRNPRGFGVQGVVYLRDTDAEQGAFCCVPEIYGDLNHWLERHEGRSFARESIKEPVESIGGKAGSMVIWHRLMPHSSGTNRGQNPRWVQYVTMDHAVNDETARQQRVDEFLQRLPPAWAIRQNVPGQMIPEPWPTADLTTLGRRLVGLEAWPD